MSDYDYTHSRQYSTRATVRLLDTSKRVILEGAMDISYIEPMGYFIVYQGVRIGLRKVVDGIYEGVVPEKEPA